MITYDQPLRMTYQIDAAAVDTLSANLLSVAGPEGLQGRLESIVAVNTTGVTGAASAVEIGDGTTTDLFGSLEVPISSADAVANTTVVSTLDETLIPADSRVVISTDGAATAGDANIFVTIAWF